MNDWVYIIGIVIVSATIIIALVIYLYHKRMYQLMDSLNAMLDKAIEGNFTETTFDESMLSAIETKMAYFLSSSVVSSKKLANEKKKIQYLISDISHQTKTPVANILLYSQLLSEQNLSKDSEVCVKALAEQAEKLDFLMVALVKASRLETGIITIRPEEREVSELINGIVAEIGPKAEEKQIAIHIIQKDQTAYYDPKWTAEAVYNVLDNAVKYSSAKSQITISTISYSMFIRIDITDHGIGIAKDEQEKIFMRFYRSPKVSEKEGVGLGLFLTREIITEGGGYVKVSSVEGIETTFSIFLPTEKR